MQRECAEWQGNLSIYACKTVMTMSKEYVLGAVADEKATAMYNAAVLVWEDKLGDLLFDDTALWFAEGNDGA